MPGVETSLPLMLTQAMAGKCSVSQVSSWMATKPAEAYKIPNKGLIKTGYDKNFYTLENGIEDYINNYLNKKNYEIS